MFDFENISAFQASVQYITSYGGFEPVDLTSRPLTQIVDIYVGDGRTSLRFEQQQDTGISGDPVLNLRDPMGSNLFIFAHGNFMNLIFILNNK